MLVIWEIKQIIRLPANSDLGMLGYFDNGILNRALYDMKIQDASHQMSLKLIGTHF